MNDVFNCQGLILLMRNGRQRERLKKLLQRLYLHISIFNSQTECSDIINSALCFQTDTRPERGPRTPNERVYAPKEWTRTRMRERIQCKGFCLPSREAIRQTTYSSLGGAGLEIMCSEVKG